MIKKNEHAISAAHFLPSILVQLCVLLSYFVASPRQEVYLYPFCTPVNHCAISVIVLPTVSQICPCSLLAGAHLTLGVAHLKHPQHRHAMSNTPFHKLIWLRIFYAHGPLFTLTIFVVCEVCFLADIRILPPCYTHVAAAAIITCRFPAPFVPIYPVC